MEGQQLKLILVDVGVVNDTALIVVDGELLGYQLGVLYVELRVRYFGLVLVNF